MIKMKTNRLFNLEIDILYNIKKYQYFNLKILNDFLYIWFNLEIIIAKENYRDYNVIEAKIQIASIIFKLNCYNINNLIVLYSLIRQYNLWGKRGGL